ncbi:MAG: transcription elongation factor GreA [Bacilli bacterium]
MKEKEVYLTESGLNELKRELDVLKLEKRPNVIDALKEARALGDLSENAEYDAARNEQAIVEGRIAEIEKILGKVVLLKKIKTDNVALGTEVTIRYVADNEEEKYFIVGSTEADPFTNKISNESPIATAIISKKVGDIVTVESPAGNYDVEVLAIS